MLYILLIGNWNFFERIFFYETYLEIELGAPPPPPLFCWPLDLYLDAWASLNKICIWEHLGRKHWIN